MRREGSVRVTFYIGKSDSAVVVVHEPNKGLLGCREFGDTDHCWTCVCLGCIAVTVLNASGFARSSSSLSSDMC